LNGVTLKGDPSQTQPVVLDVSGYPAGVAVVGDLTLDNATINVQGGTHIDFSSAAATLGGNGTVLFANDVYYNSLRPVANAGQLTIGAGITVKGAGGTIGYSGVWGGPTNVSVVNQGTVGPSQGGSFNLVAASWTSSGTLQATGGGTLNFQATAWSNTGLITETNSALNFGGTFTTANLGNYSRTGGNINLTGTLDNTATTLSLDAAHGSWN